MISYGITTHNEGVSLETLYNQLLHIVRNSGDEIVVLDDYSTDDKTLEVLKRIQSDGWIVEKRHLNKDFASQKNHLTSLCSGDYTFQLDADETLHPTLMENINYLLDSNKQVDLFYVPRVNIVTGLTDEDIARWRWPINERGWVAFPDYQSRIYRKSPDIKWVGKVHERIEGYKTYSHLPAEEEWSLIHIKDIDRQRKQNEFYSTIR